MIDAGARVHSRGVLSRQLLALRGKEGEVALLAAVRIEGKDGKSRGTDVERVHDMQKIS